MLVIARRGPPRCQAEHSRPAVAGGRRTGQLLVTGTALSIDNLVVGFGLVLIAVAWPVAGGVLQRQAAGWVREDGTERHDRY